MKRLVLCFIASVFFLVSCSAADAIQPVKAVKVSTSGTTPQSLNGDERVLGIQSVANGTEGTIVLQEQDNSGDTVLNVTTSGDSEQITIDIPGYIPFTNGVWVEFTNVDDVTIFAIEQN